MWITLFVYPQLAELIRERVETKAEIVGREVPFAYAAGKTVMRGAIDLVIRRLNLIRDKALRELMVLESAEFRVLLLRRPKL